MLFSGSRIRFQTNPPCSIRMGGNKKTKKTGQDEPIKKSNNKGDRLDNLVRINILSLKSHNMFFFLRSLSSSLFPELLEESISHHFFNPSYLFNSGKSVQNAFRTGKIHFGLYFVGDVEHMHHPCIQTCKSGCQHGNGLRTRPTTC